MKSRIDLQLSHIDATVALGQFPVSRNTNVIQLVMRAALENSGGSCATVDHVYKWALAAKPFDMAHVVTTAATAIEILAQGSSNQNSTKRK